MRTIAVVNQKGGCGKTTVSINLASCLAQEGKKTLLVDIDPQGHCAVGLAVPEEQTEQSIYDALISVGRKELFNFSEILWEISDNFELAPASIDLAAFDQQTNGITDRENCLGTLLKTSAGKYDYVVIDCPPAVGLLTFNALRAATDVIVPVETGYFSLHGLSKQLETLNILCKQCSQDINVMVLASMYDIRTKMGREILAELKKHFSDKMFKTVVNFNTKLKEAASLGQPIGEYDPASKGHKDFLALAQELIATDTQVESEAISVARKKLAITPIGPASEQIADRHDQIKDLNKSIESMSSSAQELLAGINATSDSIEIVPEAQPEQPLVLQELALDEKLNDFYGVRQFGPGTRFITLYPRANSVQIAGDFNNWQPEKTVMTNADGTGKWILDLDLAPGKYRYRMVVDGQWQQDPYNENSEMNPYGEYNSILEVK
ncbi:MAG: AAA family ATPase [Anaerohalosphaeraceae bacterium]|nr:AAA family ATPase [Anaerohalosphaeraceae bacterium]